MHICCAPGCPNRERPDTTGLTLFHFPKDEGLCRLWEAAVRREDCYSGASRAWLCSEHFSEDCFDLSAQLRARFGFGGSQNKLKLKPDAVPTIFAYNKDEREALESKRRQQVLELSLNGLYRPKPLHLSPQKKICLFPALLAPFQAPHSFPSTAHTALQAAALPTPAPPTQPRRLPPPRLVIRGVSSLSPSLTSSDQPHFRSVGCQFKNDRRVIQCNKMTQTCYWRHSVGMMTVPSEETWKVQRVIVVQQSPRSPSKIPVFHELFPKSKEYSPEPETETESESEEEESSGSERSDKDSTYRPDESEEDL
ncbi:unnamed protein product [Ixodes hexagonus]